MISLCAEQYDPEYSPILLHPGPGADLVTVPRRVSRTATLDGGCVITDHGVAHADRTLEITVPSVSSKLERQIWGLYVTYAWLRVAMFDGVYRAKISRYRYREGQLAITVLIKEKLT